jgi:hypothetical protein
VDDVTKRSGCSTRAAADVVVVLFVGALTGVWAGWGLVGVAQCCHRQLWQCKGAYEAAFLETSTHAFPILSCIFNGLFMFDLLLLFRCFPEVWRGRFGPFLCHFQPLALAFHPSFWVGASV